jgi:nitrous oxidase accessory protein
MGRISKTFALLLTLIIAMSCLTLTAIPANAQSKTIIVPDDYLTIASAIGNVSNGDRIFVKQGIYEEHSLVINKTISLIGEDKENTIIINIDEPPAWDIITRFPSAKPDVLYITADNVLVTGFTVSSTGKGFGSMTRGIYATGDGIKIIDNKITELNGVNSPFGIDAYGEGFQIVGNSILGVIDGISLNVSNSTITQNIVEEGQLVTNGENNIVMSNVISEGFTNSLNVNGDNNLVFNNSVTKQNQGISVFGSNNVIALNNATDNSLFGIAIRSTIEKYGNNRVYANSIANNRDGIFIIEGKNNSVYANNLINNHIGVTIIWYKGWMDHNGYNNTVYHNNFMRNSYGAADWSHLGLNTWDDGSEGNFWDTYTGTDANNDGIGDTPVNINVPYTIGNSDPNVYDPNESNQNNVIDRYPLMNPFKVDSVTVEIPEWALAQLSELDNSVPSFEAATTQSGTILVNTLTMVAAIAIPLFGILIAILLYRRHQKTSKSRNVD